MTLVVNLYGGPGTGKSTNAALSYGKLKVAGHEAELVTEYAKDLVWEERNRTLTFQHYIASKQEVRIHRVLGKVEVVVTDSPLLIGLIYGADHGNAWHEYLREVHNSWETLDIFLQRNPEHHPYVAAGRTQTEQQAVELDRVLREMLEEEVHDYVPLEIGPGETTAEAIVGLVETRLHGVDHEKLTEQLNDEAIAAKEECCPGCGADLRLAGIYEEHGYEHCGECDEELEMSI